jgi:hypothetical protein
VPQAQQELGCPLHDAGVALLVSEFDANTDSFLVKRVEPHLGQEVPFHRLLRTSISLSLSHF